METEATKGTLWLVFTTGCPIKAGLLTKPSYSSYGRHHARRLSSYWGTSATPTSAENWHGEL